MRRAATSPPLFFRVFILLLTAHQKEQESDSRLLIIESLIPDKNEFSIAKLLDLEVLVMGGGKERTEAEYRELLEKSGFSLSRIIPTNESISILECRKRAR